LCDSLKASSGEVVAELRNISNNTIGGKRGIGRERKRASEKGGISYKSIVTNKFSTKNIHPIPGHKKFSTKNTHHAPISSQTPVSQSTHIHPRELISNINEGGGTRIDINSTNITTPITNQALATFTDNIEQKGGAKNSQTDSYTGETPARPVASSEHSEHLIAKTLNSNINTPVTNKALDTTEHSEHTAIDTFNRPIPNCTTLSPIPITTSNALLTPKRTPTSFPRTPTTFAQEKGEPISNIFIKETVGKRGGGCR